MKKTQISREFIDAAYFWYNSSYLNVSVKVCSAEVEYLSNIEFRKWCDCNNNDTLAFFDLLVGAAEAS